MYHVHIVHDVYHVHRVIIVIGSNFEITLYQKNMWLRTMYCLQIIWQEDRGFQQRSWGADILSGEDMVQAGCD